MTKDSNQEGRPKNLWRIGIILFILAGLPAISYYYLQGGMNIRKEALAKKDSYGKALPIWVIYPDGQKENQIEGKVCVIHIFGEDPDLTADNSRILDTCEKLFNQFGTNNDFRLALIARNGTAEFRSKYQKMPSSDYVTWAWNGSVGQWRTVIENGYDYFTRAEGIKPVKEYFAVCDKAGQIHRFYNALSDEDINKMVQHIAILLQ